MINQNKSYRVLVVEDNPGDYFLLEEYFKLSNLPVEKIFHTKNMALTIELVKDNTFDIVLLDLTLPDSTGVDSVITLDRLLPNTPIVVFSGLPTIEIARESISLGAQDYLVKGEFDHNLLAKSVQYSIERKKTMDELAEQKINKQKLITETTLSVQEKEKTELGRELHDNIGQILATVKIYLSMLRSGTPSEEDLIEKSYEYVNYAIDELRSVSHSLVAPSLNGHSLKKVLAELVDDINSFHRLYIQLNIDEKLNEIDIDHNKELMIYRILQEQLSNIIKHANADAVSILLKIEDDNLLLIISDDGDGFDTSVTSDGIGLKNIKSRVDHYSGSINIISAPGEGCTIEISVAL
ncbi:MAG: response regulator [Ginsengibacter sp.]